MLERLRQFLGLERNVIVMLTGILFIGLGEELWMRFMPKYLEFLGAGALTIAAYGMIKDLLDALYQYPGGWLTDRLGRRTSLIVFTLVAITGYAIYFFSRSWEWLLLGTIFTAAWGTLNAPAIFAIIGDTLSSRRRAMGFGVQSILKRIPVMLAPLLGGWLLVSAGFVNGMKLGFAVTIILAVVSIDIVRRYYDRQPSPAHEHIRFRELWKQLHPRLKRLLIADCLARWAEGIPEVFIILYVMNVIGMNSLQFGSLTSIAMLTAVLVYIPIAKLSDKMNRKPFVLLTFVFFALYPLAIVVSSNFILLAAAFVVGGLREIGEPARKAMIVDLASETTRGRTVGLYYLVRGMAVFPAAIAGGWLWTVNHRYPFYAAFGVGLFGLLAFALWGSDGRPSAQPSAGKGTA
jgi:MFS family permease